MFRRSRAAVTARSTHISTVAGRTITIAIAMVARALAMVETAENPAAEPLETHVSPAPARPSGEARRVSIRLPADEVPAGLSSAHRRREGEAQKRRRPPGSF